MAIWKSLVASLIVAVVPLAAANQTKQTDEALRKMANSPAELAAQNLQKANAFLIENGKRSGIVTSEDGKLQIEFIKKGTGAKVESNSTPLVHYTGTFIDGTAFDSSRNRGPAAFPLDRVIAGFSKGMLGMQEGEVRKIYIHPDLGYGTQGRLPPNSLLIFEIEVLKANTN